MVTYKKIQLYYGESGPLGIKQFNTLEKMAKEQGVKITDLTKNIIQSWLDKTFELKFLLDRKFRLMAYLRDKKKTLKETETHLEEYEAKGWDKDPQFIEVYYKLRFMSQDLIREITETEEQLEDCERLLVEELERIERGSENA